MAKYHPIILTEQIQNKHNYPSNNSKTSLLLVGKSPSNNPLLARDIPRIPFNTSTFLAVKTDLPNLGRIFS
ncbi:hypothetical protein [Epilithonimonas sp.]|uniref:hypothetical protein n=1 Tax=Epilithonimonas sp. TaxID=2894511 RepID=UPI0028B02DDB|nr:hypothetical protein [Epilithonimonas sp.]